MNYSKLLLKKNVRPIVFGFFFFVLNKTPLRTVRTLEPLSLRLLNEKKIHLGVCGGVGVYHELVAV